VRQQVTRPQPLLVLPLAKPLGPSACALCPVTGHELRVLSC